MILVSFSWNDGLRINSGCSGIGEALLLVADMRRLSQRMGWNMPTFKCENINIGGII